MPTLLRVLRPGFPLDRTVSDGQPCATVLRNFVDDGKDLSFFEVTESVHVEDIAFAVAKARKGIDDVDYCTVPQEDLIKGDLHFNKTPGTTGVANVDANHWDSVRVSIARASYLASYCVEKGGKGRVSSKDIGLRLTSAIDQGLLDVGSLNDNLKENLAKFRKSSHYKAAQRR